MFLYAAQQKLTNLATEFVIGKKVVAWASDKITDIIY